jgi:hypothetical protein
MEREVAVRRLIDRYAHGCDTNDPALVASLFGATGELVVRGVVYTGNEIREFYTGRLDIPTLHFMTGITIAERGDDLLDVTCGLFALEMPDEAARGVVGRYHDVVRLADGVAEFVRREIDISGRLPR